MFSSADRDYMALALELAKHGLYSATPNPRVGCVIVNGGEIVGKGWHQRAGEAHAEVHALREAGVMAQGATAYVTLEPCAHAGRTSPCTEALIAAKVVRVVCAMGDPNPLTAGGGLKHLTAAGISAECGLFEREAKELNIGFVTRMKQKRPWIRLKIAASLDGKTALYNGVSQWITGPAARQDGHSWRARACAIASGIGTIIADDPLLNVREVATDRQPLKVIVDSLLRISLDAHVFKTGNVLVATITSDHEKIDSLKARGAEVALLPDKNGQVDLFSLMNLLSGKGVNELHVEGGRSLNGALVKAGLADELLIYLAPSLIGDKAFGMFTLQELDTLSEKQCLSIHDVRMIESDVRIMARFLRQDVF